MTSKTAKINAADKLREKSAREKRTAEWVRLLKEAEARDAIPLHEEMMSVDGATEVDLDAFYRSHL